MLRMRVSRLPLARATNVTNHSGATVARVPKRRARPDRANELHKHDSSSIPALPLSIVRHYAAAAALFEFAIPSAFPTTPLYSAPQSLFTRQNRSILHALYLP